MSGKLILNAVVIYDHQTETLWSQFLQEAVDGPLAGTKLDLIPTPATTWAAWKAEHPDTLLLDRRSTLARRADPYAGYYQSNSAGILGEAAKNDRLPRKTLVVGLDWGGEARAYDFGTLAAEEVVNDRYGGADIVVTFDSQARSQAVFDRRLADGRVLDFVPVGALEMRDAETGSTWLRSTGAAISGPLAGTRPTQLASFVAFWFAWTDFHPATFFYEAPGATSWARTAS